MTTFNNLVSKVVPEALETFSDPDFVGEDLKNFKATEKQQVIPSSTPTPKVGP